MEENKYYTPSLEEFYIGFEYEYITTDNIWVVDIFGSVKPSDTEQMDFEIVKKICLEYPNEIRVKYLNKQDLIELGFNADPSGERYFELNEFQLYVNIHQEFNVTIFNDDAIIVFLGLIKNKSELIKVLKMLGIK